MSATVLTDLQLASPVKFDDHSRKRFGVLVARGERLQLLTGAGVELDADRRQLVNARASDSLPRVTFELSGRRYDLRLIGAAGSHDTAALEAQVKDGRGYVQQSAAVAPWQAWLCPPTPEQQAALLRGEAERREAERFRSNETLAGPHAGICVWSPDSALPMLLRRTGEQLTLCRPSGGDVALGRAADLRVSWTGRGARTQLQVQTPGAPLMLGFREPPVRGGGSSGGDEPLLWLILFPVGLTLMYLDRRRIRRRIRACKALLSPERGKAAP